MADPVQRICAATIDGRCRAPRYIQSQLRTLHAALLQESSNLQQAIVKDTACSSSEAWFEVNMTIQSVKAQYESIHFKDFLEQEYSLAHGKHNLDRRLPYGCAYIVPFKHNRLYSMVQPAVAAMIAGNCVVVEIEHTLSVTEKIFRQIVQQKMDRDTFIVVDQKPDGGQLPRAQTKFCATDSNQLIDSSPQILKSLSSLRVVAVVDRSSNINAAAEMVVRACMAFNGKSPYAPDVALVNEFAVKEFQQAAMKVLTQMVSETEDSAPRRPVLKPKSDKDPQGVKTRILIETARGSIEVVSERNEMLLSQKLCEPRLLILPVSSLDDAIDVANLMPAPLLATYIFADAKAAKYLSQFIVSELSLTNFIPLQLLVGPPAPQGHPVSFLNRYTKDMFSFPSPEHTASAQSNVKSGEILELDTAEWQAQLPAKSQESLSDMGQPSGKSIGFFEQGLFTGLAISSTLIVGSLALAGRYAVPALVKRWS